MIPGPWTSLVLALAVYRVFRLVGWDDLPVVVKARMWVVGAELVQPNGSVNRSMKITNEPDVEPEWRYRRPQLAHFIQCPYCVGFWISVLVYVWWLLSPTSCLYAMFAFALNGAAGIISRNLDP